MRQSRNGYYDPMSSPLFKAAVTSSDAFSGGLGLDLVASLDKQFVELFCNITA